MNNIYLGLSLSLFCVFLAYFVLSKLVLVAVFCVILAGLHFKDDIVFRYIATHVASLYLWICETYSNLLNMYHQSNNVNLPVRKCIDDNGAVSRKSDRLHHRLKPNVSHNLNSSYFLETQPLSSSSWNSSSNFPTSPNSPSHLSNRSQTTLQTLSRLNINPNIVREENVSSSTKTKLSESVSHRSPIVVYPRNTEYTKRNDTRLSSSDENTKVDSGAILDAKLFANVNSPGFCSRVAERLRETMTHQPQYDTVGAFPVVHLKSQSPKIKVKTPVRVRLAPLTNDVLYPSPSSNSALRSPVMGTDESMKSVLQVLKEISRKRIHSNVEEDCEDNSKRLRITEAQYDTDGVIHPSLLQQTIQGKRAREDSSPTEDDIKKRRRPLQNNEILSSLSSSVSIKPPHLKSTKRKALEDSSTSTPVLGKLLKVQAEISPPPPTPSPSVSVKHTGTPSTEEPKEKTPQIPDKASPVEPITCEAPTPLQAVQPAKTVSIRKKPLLVDTDEDGTVSRLLGRMSGQVVQADEKQIPAKKDVFMSTNDLGLSPPKENRLAAMIAVLGGPREDLEVATSQSKNEKQERNIKGKALFTTPETPETPKESKKVTFADSLSTTKFYDRDELNSEKSSVKNGPSVVSHSTSLNPLTFGVSSSPVPTEQKATMDSQIPNVSKPVGLNFGSPLSSGNNESAKKIEDVKNPSIPSTPTGTSTLFEVSTQSPSFFQQTNNTSLVVSSASSTLSQSTNVPNTSTNTIENNKPIGFSFGTSNSSSLNKGGTSQQPPIAAVAPKPFAFSGDTKIVSTSLGFSSQPINTAAQTENTKSMSTSELRNAAGQTKPSFSPFSTKGTPVGSTNNSIENKQLVNGFTPASVTSPFEFGSPATKTATAKPLVSAFGSNVSSATPAFNFGSSPFQTNSTPTPSTTISTVLNSGVQNTSSNSLSQLTPASSVSSQSAQPINMFSKAAGNSSETIQNPFGIGIQTPSQGASMFGNVTSQSNVGFKGPNTSTNQTSSQGTSLFVNVATQGTAFGVAATVQSSSEFKPGTITGTPQKNNIFGNISSNTELKTTAFGTGGTTLSQSTTTNMFGLSTTPQATNSPFGVSINNTASQANTMFGNPPTTTQPSSLFGNISSGLDTQNKSAFPVSTTANGQPSPFSATGTALLSKSVFPNSSSTPTFGALNTSSTAAFIGQNNSSAPAFGSHTSTATTFGNQNNTAAPTFGNQTKTTTSTFGNQTNTTTPTFGNQTNTTTPTFGNQTNTTTPSFGNQNNSATPTFGSQNSTTQSGFSVSTPFGSSAALNIGTSSANSNQPKPTAFGSSSSPFVFGGSTSNKEPTKPFGMAAPFSFGSNAQQSSTSVTNSSQPSAPTFGSSSIGFGTNQPVPTFGTTNSSQPSAPVFAFGQTPSAPGQTFQFNAAGPQPVQGGGGMFSIGSGSSAPRNKTGALRRRHKPT